MTTANMKIVTLATTFPDQLELSDAKLDEGEHIVKRVVELEKLYDILKGNDSYISVPQLADLRGHIYSYFPFPSSFPYFRKEYDKKVLVHISIVSSDAVLMTLSGFRC